VLGSKHPSTRRSRGMNTRPESDELLLAEVARGAKVMGDADANCLQDPREGPEGTVPPTACPG
jgi:hypothetical protein